MSDTHLQMENADASDDSEDDGFVVLKGETESDSVVTSDAESMKSDPAEKITTLDNDGNSTVLPSPVGSVLSYFASNITISPPHSEPHSRSSSVSCSPGSDRKMLEREWRWRDETMRQSVDLQKLPSHETGSNHSLISSPSGGSSISIDRPQQIANEFYQSFEFQ